MLNSIAWAWQLEEGDLCCWSMSTKKILTYKGNRKYKPSPGAKPVCVRMILNKDFTELKRRKSKTAINKGVRK